ncbi:O-antigen polymerase [Rossellomorea sp. NS-SX7]|uniref:O-antigen polymerase n=1 Tax=Rossellomorea sp. NS-SX7 TaxID=3463856 RepID=UPI00405893F0
MVSFLKLLNMLLIVMFFISFKKLKKSNNGFSPIFGFLMGVIYFILFPFTLLTFIESFKVNPLSGAKGVWSSVDLNNPVFHYPYFVIWTVLFLISLIIIIYPFKTKESNSEFLLQAFEKNITKIKFILVISILIQSIDWGVVIIEFGGISGYFGHHWYMRNDLMFNTYGSLYVIFVKIIHSNKLIFTGTSILLTLYITLKYKKINLLTNPLLLTSVVFHLLIVVITGNRIYFAIYLLFVFANFILLNVYKPIYKLLILSPVVLFIFSAWSYTRSSLTNLDTAVNNYVQVFSDFEYAIVSMLFDISEGANILAAFHIIKDYGKVFELLNGLTFLKVIYPIFPDFIEKVDSFTVIAGRIYEPGTNLSLNSTMVAEFYANFGTWSLILIPMLTLIIVLISKYVNFYSSPILAIMLCEVFLWSVRSVFSDNFISMIIVAFLLTLEILFYNLLLTISNRKARERRIA